MNRDVEMVTEARLPRGPMLLRSACQLSRFLNIGSTNMPPLLNPPGERYLPSICAANTSVTSSQASRQPCHMQASPAIQKACQF